mgnify:CR=1 FL=1
MSFLDDLNNPNRVSIVDRNGELTSIDKDELPKAVGLGYREATATELLTVKEEEEFKEKDIQAAFEWFEKGAGQELIGSYAKLGMLYQEGNGVEHDLEKAKEYLSKAGFDM